MERLVEGTMDLWMERKVEEIKSIHSETSCSDLQYTYSHAPQPGLKSGLGLMYSNPDNRETSFI